MNGIIIIDKMQDWTSHDVVGKLRSVLRERRIGHGGTLDPMATGVLPVFVGRATRAATFCESAEKEYIAGLRLGIVTDTQDTTGTVLETCDQSVTQEQLVDITRKFVGDIMQTPPMYSAVKVGGKKLYELARKGVEIERPARMITVKELEVVGKSGDDFILRIVCSKGTYVRTLCHDIGAALGCGAAMSSLRRTRAGAFGLDSAVSLDDVIRAAANGEADSLITPVDQLFAEHPSINISGRSEMLCRNGVEFPMSVPDGRYRVYGEGGVFLMIGDASNGKVKTVKSFFEVE